MTIEKVQRKRSSVRASRFLRMGCVWTCYWTMGCQTPQKERALPDTDPEPHCVEDDCEQPDPLSCEVAGCPENEFCESDGRCTEVHDTIEVEGSGGQPAKTNSGGASGCVDIDVSYEQVIPTVGLLIDRSLSMQAFDGFGDRVTDEILAGTYEPWGCPVTPGLPLDDDRQKNPDWRWNVVRNVLFHPERGVVPTFEHQVRFGMTLFTYQPDVTPEICPELIEVGFGLGNSEELLSAMACDDLGWKTPTRESLAVVAESLHAFEADGPKMIIVATDGAPNSCACHTFGETESVPLECRASTTVEREGRVMTPSEAENYDTVQEARRVFEELGISVSVIDVSSSQDSSEEDDSAHLAELAQSAGGRVYDGLDPTGLSDAFFELVGGIRSCAVDLGGNIVSGEEDQGTVLFDGQALSLVSNSEQDPEAEEKGYRVVSPSRIELVGPPCESLKSGNHEISISFPCNTFEVIR